MEVVFIPVAIPRVPNVFPIDFEDVEGLVGVHAVCRVAEHARRGDVPQDEGGRRVAAGEQLRAVFGEGEAAHL